MPETDHTCRPLGQRSGLDGQSRARWGCQEGRVVIWQGFAVGLFAKVTVLGEPAKSVAAVTAERPGCGPDERDEIVLLEHVDGALWATATIATAE